MVNQSLSTTDGLIVIMYKFSISSKFSDYFVQLHDGHLELSAFTPRFWIIDNALKDLASPFARAICLEASEENKNLDTCERVLSYLAEEGCKRQDSIGVIGGGFTQDIGTLVSSLYMRGVEWIYFPSTLMSMMDSCIGGKSSINIRSKKNVLGNFFPPKEIHIYPKFVDTLSKSDIASGLLEGIKICFARDPSSMDSFGQEMSNLLNGVSNTELGYQNLISQSLKAKKWFLEIDEFDTKERQLLNFGHTFGHALESSMGYRIPHGIAVGLGMLAAINFAQAHHYKDVVSLQQLIGKIIEFSEYSVTKESFPDRESFLGAFSSDKKHTVEKYFLILPTEKGLAKSGFAKSQVTLERVYDSVLEVINSLG